MIQSIKRAVDILSFVAMQPDGMPVTLTNMALATNLDPSTCARIVATLCECAYLEKISRKEGYVLGPMVYFNFSGKHYRKTLLKNSLSVMRKLCELTQRSVSLCTYAFGRLYVLYSIHWKGQDEVERVSIQPGKLYGSAAGRVFVAFMGREEWDQLYQQIGMPSPEEWPGVQTQSDLAYACQRIRNRKYAVIRHVGGMTTGVSAPIFLGGQLVATVGTALPDADFEGDFAKMVVYHTCMAANAISNRLSDHQMRSAIPSDAYSKREEPTGYP